MSAQPAPTRATTPTHERPANEYAALSVAIDHARQTGDETDHAEHQPARHRPIVARLTSESMGANPCPTRGIAPTVASGMKATTQTDLDKSDERPDVRSGSDVHDRHIRSQEVLKMMFKMSRFAGGFAGVAALTVACGGVNSDRAGGAANVDPVVVSVAHNSDVLPS